MTENDARSRPPLEAPVNKSHPEIIKNQNPPTLSQFFDLPANGFTEFVVARNNLLATKDRAEDGRMAETAQVTEALAWAE